MCRDYLVCLDCRGNPCERVIVDNQGSFRFLKHLADLGRETGEIEGLDDQLEAGIAAALMDDRILRITRREKDLQIASELSGFICYLSAIERSR